MDVRNDPTRRQQRFAILFTSDGSGATPRPLDLRPQRSQASLRADRIATPARRAGRIYLLYVAALRVCERSAELRAQRHRRRLERPGVAAVDAVRGAP